MVNVIPLPLEWPGGFLTFLVVFLASVAVNRRWLANLYGIPGPFWASITRFWHVYHIFRGDQNVQIIALHEKHGHFVRIAPNEVSISHPDGPDLLYRASLRKGDWYRAFAIPDYRYTTPHSTLDPKEKTERSKIFSSGYALSSLLRSEEHMDRNIGNLLDWMDQFSHNREPMDLDRFLAYTAFDNVGEAIFSESFGFISSGQDVRGAIKNNLTLTPYVAVAGFYYWLYVVFVANPVITWTGIMPMGHLFDTARTALDRRKENPDARFDMVAHWLRAHQRDPKRLSIQDIEAQTMANVGAGSDTVTSALQSFIYYMIRHPLSWDRAREEIEKAQARGLCQDRVISYHDAQTLLYLKACINEAMRLFPPGPFSMPRVSPKGGITIGDRHFPEGTVLSIHYQAVQLSKECWGEDAREWNPDRWFADDIVLREKYWLVFGLGYNRCPGHHLAKLQLSKIAATIVRDYSIRMVNPQSEWKWKAYFTCVPHSWPVYVERRHETS